MSWPAVKTVRAARFGHVAEVIGVPEGFIKGLRSGTPHVVAQVDKTGAVACCTRCNEREPEPNPPGAMAFGAARTPLLAPGTEAHATFLLTWLNQFEKKHAECAEVPA